MAKENMGKVPKAQIRRLEMDQKESKKGGGTTLQTDKQTLKLRLKKKQTCHCLSFFFFF